MIYSGAPTAIVYQTDGNVTAKRIVLMALMRVIVLEKPAALIILPVLMDFVYPCGGVVTVKTTVWIDQMK